MVELRVLRGLRVIIVRFQELRGQQDRQGLKVHKVIMV
jgi:hypothetical protein